MGLVLENISKQKYDGKKLSQLFPAVMFWDVNMDILSLEYDKDFIIQRVLGRFMDNEKYLDILESIYSLDEIKSFALSSDEIF